MNNETYHGQYLGLVAALSLGLVLSVTIDIGQAITTRSVTKPNSDSVTNYRPRTVNRNIVIVGSRSCIVETTSRIGSNQYGLTQIWSDGNVKLFEGDQLVFEKQLRVSGNKSE